MNVTYTVIRRSNGDTLCINRSDGWSIPVDPNNGDYQDYLRWLAEGNEPAIIDQPEGA